ncbi:MAG TPA: VOC family protein [Chitinophagaceae bacterium]|jgi:hypothetical protein|nr:VOC family protein [Chitinophagaceae bacterium]
MAIERNIGISCISLPVADIRRSYRFYTEALGFPAPPLAEGADHMAFRLGQGLHFVILLRSDFEVYGTGAGVTLAGPGQAGCVLSYFAGSKAEVDGVLQGVAAAGGRVTPPKEEAWGYAGFFSDPDGHLWEVMYNARLNDAFSS